MYVLAVIVVAVAGLGAWIRQPSLAGSSRSEMQVEAARLRAHVQRLSVDYVPRCYLNTENLEKCASYIEAEFAAAGARVTRQHYSAWGFPCANVIGQFGPTNAPQIVVGAHYDACDETPGANDNASGVAGAIELAGLLGQAGTLPVGVQVIGFCTEEPPMYATPHMGSYRHAQSLKTNGVEVMAMMALEMIGCFKDERGSQRYPVPLLHAYYPSRGNFIAVVGNTDQSALIARVKRSMKGTTELPVYSIRAPRKLPGIDFSDHRSYWEAGYPAVMITDTAFYRSNTYHESDDTMEKLDYARMANVVVGVYEAVLDLAGVSR